MTEELSTRDGIKIRKLGPGYYVREDEWDQFIEINEVRFPVIPKHGVHLTSRQPLNLSYMIDNAPFEDLLPQYMPLQKLGHFPPRLSFGFAIPDEHDTLLRAALEQKLERRKVLMKMEGFHPLQVLVLAHLNKECDLPPKGGIRVNGIYSEEACFVLELETNYEKLMPTEKMVKAIKVIKRVFKLPRGARPKWYLEDDIDLRDPVEFLFKRKSPVSVLHNSGTKCLTSLCRSVHVRMERVSADPGMIVTVPFSNLSILYLRFPFPTSLYLAFLLVS